MFWSQWLILTYYVSLFANALNLTNEEKEEEKEEEKRRISSKEYK